MADEIDDLLRHAMKSLDDQVPSGYFDDLPQRTLGRLEVSLMQTGSDQEPASTSSGAPVPPEEDSGLHDIRNLAQTTKQRISSRKITNTASPDDDMIANSSSGWRAVALPEPAKMISLPDLADLPVRPTKLAEASAVELPDVTPIDARVPRRPVAAKRRNRTIAIVGVGFAAAAGLVLFVATRNRGVTGVTDKGDETRGRDGTGATGAMTPPPETTSQKPQAPGGPNANVTGRPQEIASDSIKDKGSQGAFGGGSATPDAATTSVTPELDKNHEGTKIEQKIEQKPEQKPDKLEVPVKSIGKGMTKSPPPKKGKDTAGKPSPKEVPLTKQPTETVPSKPETRSDNDGGKKKKTTKKDDEPSFDDLLKEAGETGGGEKKQAKPKLDKSALSGDDFKKGMAGIQGRATACYKGTPGTVAVRVAIGPDGHVQKVVVSGSFAGTPSGECVAAAVKGASFPAWDGPPQSFGYSFLLSE